MKHNSPITKVVVSLIAIAFFIVSGIALKQARCQSEEAGTAGQCGLRTIVAEPWLKISDLPDPQFLPEGPAFDREGHLYFVDVYGKGKVYKLTLSEQNIMTIYNDGRSMFTSLDIHKDGRLFLCDLNDNRIVAMNPDGTGVTNIVTDFQGGKIYPDDMVFDNKGNFYFTDFQGSALKPTGRVFRVSSDFREIDFVTDHLALPNGISLAPQGRRLWIGEFGRNALLELNLNPDGISLMFGLGALWVHRFTGDYGPDSNAVDKEGNVYQVIYPQGKIVIFNKTAIPVAEVVIPKQDRGKYMSTTNLAFQPGTDTAFMTAGGDAGAYIYKFKGLAKGLLLFSHQSKK